MIKFSFKPVSIGIIFALGALLAGMLHGMAFGAKEDAIIDMFKKNAQATFVGQPDEVTKATEGAWKYLKRAHYHFMGLGAMAAALCMFAGAARASDKVKMVASTLVGFGSFVYPLHFTLSAFKASHIGKHAGHEAYALVAQAGAGTSLLGLLAMIAIAFMWMWSGDKETARD
ncbi:MAG: hypothetical protein OEY50_01365 [Nitrospinota bacterium]|nr:hypothetical protein [Nitrospinota bacterium]MDH5678251.1 hypothetical protein [Nitrospinota bacterium]MDH5757214.1 hypothetical protein [Nitrospinota bacterium]